LSGSFLAVFSLPLEIAAKKFQEILRETRKSTHCGQIVGCGRRLATGAVSLQRMTVKKAYARACVDVDLANRLKRQIRSLVRQTRRPQVLGRIGGFGGLFLASFPGMREPVLVASIDGVGTKLKIAFAMNKHHTVGADLVSHCVNDIAVLGARPLFFLDYIGCEALEPRMFQQLLRSVCRACRAAGCAQSQSDMALLATWKKRTMSNCQRPLGRNHKP
jgi:AIR synthase related protein